MNKFTVRKAKDIQTFLEERHFCHDASIVEVVFKKSRDIEDGSLVYPMEEDEIVDCNIRVVLLTDADERMPKGKIIIFNFYKVKTFSFLQKKSYDYSDLYEISFRSESPMVFSFLATKNKIEVLKIESDAVDFEEKKY